MATRTDDHALLAWEKTQPASITGDSVWRLDCYRESLFLLRLARDDVAISAGQSTSRASGDQLLSAMASVGANIAEGYGRGTNADRARFFTYALGSAREAVVWYQTVLPPDRAEQLADRLDRLARVKRMLLGLLARITTKNKKPFESW